MLPEMISDWSAYVKKKTHNNLVHPIKCQYLSILSEQFYTSGIKAAIFHFKEADSLL